MEDSSQTQRGGGGGGVMFDSVMVEKANAMRRYRWRQNLRWILKACVPLAPLSYALSGNAARQLLSNVFNSNLCVFLLLNALVLLTFLMSGHNTKKSVSAGGDETSDLYGEYIAAVESRRNSAVESRRSEIVAGGVAMITPEDDEVVVVAGDESPATVTVTETTLSPVVEEVTYENVDVVESVPVCEEKAVTEFETVVVVSPIIEVEKVKRGGYRRTKSESFYKKKKEEEEVKPEKNFKRSETARRSKLDDLTDEEFKRHCDRLSAFIRPISRS